MDILVKREIAKRMVSPSQVEFTPVEPLVLRGRSLIITRGGWLISGKVSARIL